MPLPSPWVALLAAFCLVAVPSCGGPSKHQMNIGADIPIYQVSAGDFRDMFPQLPHSNACTVVAPRVEVYLTADTKDEAVRQAIHELMHVHRAVGGKDLLTTLEKLSSPKWDAASCGKILER